MAAKVENLTAFAFPVLRMERFARNPNFVCQFGQRDFLTTYHFAEAGILMDMRTSRRCVLVLHGFWFRVEKLL